MKQLRLIDDSVADQPTDMISSGGPPEDSFVYELQRKLQYSSGSASGLLMFTVLVISHSPHIQLILIWLAASIQPRDRMVMMP